MPSQKKEKLLSLARDRFKQAVDASSRMRELALDDLRFSVGDQWPDGIKRQRDADGRPCLTINRLPAFIRQVVNDQRMNRPAIKISPVDDQGDPETAEIMAGLCRHIEAASGADIAYDTAFESAVRCGFGAFRILTEYVGPDSFDQEIVIKRIRNAFSVYYDPNAQEVDYSDAKWCFLIEDLTKEAYEEAYPDSDAASGSGWEALGNRAPGWITPSGIRVAEYFYLEEKPVTLALIQTQQGTFTVPKDQVPEGMPILRERDTKIPTIQWCKLNGIEVLDENEWPGRYIPVVPVLGDEAEVDGQVILGSLVRNAKDSQRMYNFWASAETEAIALAPKAPFLVAEGQIEGYESEWQTANVRNIPYLSYKPLSLGGQVLGAPQRQTAEPAIQAISHARLMSSDDIKATTGLFDASLGARGNEQSGRAIMARQREGDTATFHYSDNLSRAIRYCGKILLDLIPHVYDTERVVRIVGLDGEAESVKINGPTMKGGIRRVFDLTAGHYDVVVSTGPSYGTKREQSVDAMLELAKAYPPLMQIAGDLVVKAMDWPGSEALAERLEMALPPELKPKDDNQPQIPPQVQAAVQQLSQQHEMLTSEVHRLQNELDSKSAELASKERIAQMQEETKRVVAFAELNQGEGLQLLRNDLEAVKLDVQHNHQMRQQEMKHAAEMTIQQRQHEAALQQGAQQHEQGLQQTALQHRAAMEQLAAQQVGDQQMAEQEQEAQPAE